ncbi:MAG: glucose-6-phosphate isomerase [Clostridia bacterium]
MENFDSLRISLDFNNMMTENVGENGISKKELDAYIPYCVKAISNMKLKRNSMKWRELPYNQDEIVKDIKKTAKIIRSNYKSFVVLGIGGSALGPIAVQQALNHLHFNEMEDGVRNAPKFYVEDNIDPERMAALFDVVNPETAMFNCITKSGSTAETMSQLMIVTDVLKNKFGKKINEHLIATTDTDKGNLIKIARRENLKTFFVPDGVGGRFSELCPVGLLPAAVCGINIDFMLEGARFMSSLCENDDVYKNPACMIAVLQFLAMKKGANISVMMPYADSLKYMADWYAQLWAESLGKRYDNDKKIVNYGQTPVKALGVTDQHSQVQLYTEGPFDKVITFLAVQKFRETVLIPHEYSDIEDVSFLGGHTLNELITTELRATEYAIKKSGHMNMTINIPVVNAFTIGELLLLFELSTAFAGELLNIDAFNQPGVEEGKNATYALFDKRGYEKIKASLEGVFEKDGRYII